MLDLCLALWYQLALQRDQMFWSHLLYLGHIPDCGCVLPSHLIGAFSALILFSNLALLLQAACSVSWHSLAPMPEVQQG